MTSPLMALLRQQSEPFIVEQGSHLGVYKIENGHELERTVRIKAVKDVARTLVGLDNDGAWLVYSKAADGKATIIAMSAAMREALIPTAEE